MNLNERIAKVIEYSNLTSSEFADQVEVQRSSISHITAGRNKPSLEFIIKIKTKFPELQWDWLINGEGEMMKSEEEPDKTSENGEKSRSTSLPDLFSLIDDDNFGHTESEDKIKSEIPKSDFPLPQREFNKTEASTEKQILSDSQRLESFEQVKNIQNIENQKDRIKRIVLFFESGKFESFEP